MKQEAFHWNFRGQQLFAQAWIPESVKANVLLIHGMGEHSGRYPYLVDALTKAGYAVYGFDHIGHGLSDGKRGHVTKYDDLLDAMAAFCELMEAKGHAADFMYAHSMGANLGLNFLLRRAYPFRAAVISAPWLRLAKTPPAWQKKLGKLMLNWMPDMHNRSNLDVDLISRDKKEVKAYKDDPMVHDWITPAMFFGIEEAAEWAMAHAAELKQPVLLLHGTADGITSFEASKEFAARSAEKVVFAPQQNYYHEMHNDYQKEKVFDQVLSWFATH